jgi:AcrR family transcriptional regulator
MNARTATTRRSTAARPLRRDAQRNHDALLAAAAEVFASRGLDATLDDVAAHAGVGVATAYRHFENKNALIDALFESMIDELVASAEASLAITDPWEAFTTFLADTIERQVRNRGLRQVLQSRAGEERVSRARERLAPLTDRLFQRAQAAGMIRTDVTTTDMGILVMAVAEIGDISRQVRPNLWRRYYTLVLDAIRTDGTPLRPRPLTSREFDQAMANLNA